MIFPNAAQTVEQKTSPSPNNVPEAPKPKLFIVVPCYNEEEVLPLTAPMFREELRKLEESGRIEQILPGGLDKPEREHRRELGFFYQGKPPLSYAQKDKDENPGEHEPRSGEQELCAEVALRHPELPVAQLYHGERRSPQQRAEHRRPAGEYPVL